MLPRLIYESLPLLYIVSGLFLLLITQQPLLLFAGLMLYTSGTLVWVLRSSNRRSGAIQYPIKSWFQPEWLYELQPFIQIALVLLLWRQPLDLGLQLLSLPLASWALICLQRRKQARQHKTPSG
jgi:hypothetical protein